MFKFIATLANGMWMRAEAEVNDADVVTYRLKRQGFRVVSCKPVSD